MIFEYIPVTSIDKILVSKFKTELKQKERKFKFSLLWSKFRKQFMLTWWFKQEKDMLKKIKMINALLSIISKLQLKVSENRQKLEDLNSIIIKLKILFPEIISEINKIKELLK